MIRKTAVLAAGLVLTASVGLVGVGSASGVSPALHIKPGAKWTVEPEEGCETVKFLANYTFTTRNDFGDAGTWSGGGDTIKMRWTQGLSQGRSFIGASFANRPVREYVGTLGNKTERGPAWLVKGAVAGC